MCLDVCRFFDLCRDRNMVARLHPTCFTKNLCFVLCFIIKKTLHSSAQVGWQNPPCFDSLGLGWVFSFESRDEDFF